MNDEVSQESSTPSDFSKRYALTLLLVVIAFVHLPSVISRGFWIEDGNSKNDSVIFVVWPCLKLYLMLVCPILLVHIKPEIATFDCIWFRWKRSELVRLPLLMLCMLLIAAASYILFGILHLPKGFSLSLQSDHNSLFWIWTVTRIILLGPVVEEIFWRGYVQGTLSRVTHPWIAILGQALLFGLLHFRPMAGTLQMCLIGLVFGIWCHKRKTLLPVIIMHIVNNSVATWVALT